jgi:hypothetical protein
MKGLFPTEKLSMLAYYGASARKTTYSEQFVIIGHIRNFIFYLNVFVFGGVKFMLQTAKTLINADEIEDMLKKMVEKAYLDIKDDPMLLCIDCSDVDLYVASSGNLEFEELVKTNFKLDEYGDPIDDKDYQTLMCELHDCFIELHKSSGMFDYFPEGEYEVKGEKRESETDMLGPKGVFFAPFEDALLI